MLLVETYPPIPRLPCHNVWFARYRRNSADRLEPTAIAIAFRSSSRYGSLYSLNVIPLDWSRRDKGFGSARDGVRAANRPLEGENPRVGWAENQASADTNRGISCLHSVCSNDWRRGLAARAYVSLIRPTGPNRTGWIQISDAIG